MSRILESDAPDFTDWQVTPQSRLRFQRIGKDLKTEYIHHMDLDRSTTDPNWAWTGPMSQAMGARKKHPLTREFSLVRINHAKKR